MLFATGEALFTNKKSSNKVDLTNEAVKQSV